MLLLPISSWAWSTVSVTFCACASMSLSPGLLFPFLSGILYFRIFQIVLLRNGIVNGNLYNERKTQAIQSGSGSTLAGGATEPNRTADTDGMREGSTRRA